MVFGDPYRFAIWVDSVSEWGESFPNGLLYILINGKMFPDEIRTSTLSVDAFELINESNPLVSLPVNAEIFNLSASEAFISLMSLAYPEPLNDDDYPDQIFDYCINSSDVNLSGMRLFAVSDGLNTKIFGAKTDELLPVAGTERNEWKKIENVLVEETIISNNEIVKIINAFREYVATILNDVR